FVQEVYSTVSTNARNLLSCLLEAEPFERITAEAALRHPWLAGSPTPLHKVLASRLDACS
ncbi:unnamed protein product, partial [Hapterophycus canaliculatus]